MADCVCHYILLVGGFQNFVTRVTKNPATVTRKIVAATVNVVKGLQNNIQGDSTEAKWLLDHGYHASPSFVRSPTFQRQSAIYQKRSYNGMKKLESFQSHRLFSI